MGNSVGILIKIWTTPVVNGMDIEFLRNMHRIYGHTANKKHIDLGFYKPEIMTIDLDVLIGLTISEAVDSIMNSKHKAAKMIYLLEN